MAAVYHNSHEEAEAVCASVRKMGGRALAIQADVADPESIAEAVGVFRKQFDRVDFVVSNAAIGVLRPGLELTLKHWRRCLETNALALNLLAQQAVPLMAHGGRLIAISSLGAWRAIPHYAFIGASKAALESLVRSLAQELGPRGIRVNAVSAGVVDTDALKYFPNREQLLGESARRAPAGPTLTPEHVADAVYLLCRPEAAMISGHTLVVEPAIVSRDEQPKRNGSRTRRQSGLGDRRQPRDWARHRGGAGHGGDESDLCLPRKRGGPR